MGWRDKYKVHPSADVFPMMSDEELDALAADIKANGLRISIWFQAIEGKRDIQGGRILIAGRNRLEAMERAGMATDYATLKDKVWKRVLPHHESAAAFIISENIHRRHLTKQEQADLIVAALKAGEEEAEKLCQVGTVSAEPHKGGRGKKNPLKAEAIAISMAFASALCRGRSPERQARSRSRRRRRSQRH